MSPYLTCSLCIRPTLVKACRLLIIILREAKSAINIHHEIKSPPLILTSCIIPYLNIVWGLHQKMSHVATSFLLAISQSFLMKACRLSDHTLVLKMKPIHIIKILDKSYMAHLYFNSLLKTLGSTNNIHLA